MAVPGEEAVAGLSGVRRGAWQALGAALVLCLVAYGLRSMLADPLWRMVGTELDSVQYLWGIWWLHAQAATPQGLFGTTYLANYPAGARGMVMAPLSALIAGPVLAWKGPVAAYNFVWMFNLLLMAAGVVALARRVTGSGRAAVVAGVAMVASRPPFFNVAMGQLHGGTLGWVGLGGALWWGAWGPWYRMLLGGMLMGIALVESPYALLAVGASCAALGFAGIRRMVRQPETRRDTVKALGSAAAGVLLLALPQAYLLLGTHSGMVKTLQTDTLTVPGLGMALPVFDDLDHHVAFLDFLNPFIRPSFDAGARILFLHAGGGMYLGLVALGLALVTRAGRKWALVALGFVAMSLGSMMKIGPFSVLGPFGVFNAALNAVLEPFTMPDLFAVYAPMALSVGAALGAVRVTGDHPRRWLLILVAVALDAAILGGPSLGTPSLAIGHEVSCVAEVVSRKPGAVHYIGARNRPHGIADTPPRPVEMVQNGAGTSSQALAESLRLAEIQGTMSESAATVGRPFLLQAFHHQPSTQTGLPPRWTFLGPMDPRVEALTKPGHPVHAWLTGRQWKDMAWTWDLPVRWVLVQDPDNTLGTGPLGSPVARCGDMLLFEQPGASTTVQQDASRDTGRQSGSEPSGAPPQPVGPPEPPAADHPPARASTARPTPGNGTAATLPTGPDGDQDGIPDARDACPAKPETRNGFWDDDGCPEIDTDGDGIVDPVDDCPRKSESFDGVWDEDGCPEKDTDGDGIPDAIDRCKKIPETLNALWDTDGCPEEDRDGDGILDPVDLCPDRPETRNDLWDEDGCPERDTDGDGIVDALDACPKKSETRNGFWDEDGCPETDQDHDGIVVPEDQCPHRKETVNGLWDDDGCPEFDRDRDGVLDPLDLCPKRKETVNGLWDEDGCPEPDTDHDGISDPIDECPDRKESRNGFADQDGCPDQVTAANLETASTKSRDRNSLGGDQDGDSVPDHLDRCPQDRETINGWRDADGCPEEDTDQDGIPDRRDRCPREAETWNRFRDTDGCPEPDQDEDGIPDLWDRCPRKPETLNDYQDVDGCPEKDTDQDGILDLLDRCPRAKEDQNNLRDQDGCPEKDTDQDGILDLLDRCPKRPESLNGFRDDDGCPEKDSDHDGIVDPLDRCPGKPETKNRFRDDDGCPEKDPDHDGIVAPLDRCPNIPETVNGFRDDDGCPEKDSDHDGIPDRADRCPHRAEQKDSTHRKGVSDGCPDS